MKEGNGALVSLIIVCVRLLGSRYAPNMVFCIINDKMIVSGNLIPL